MTKDYGRQKRRMWERDPHCYWCGIETVIVEGTRLPPNAATIDHIRSKFSPQRTKQPGKPWRAGIRVLACSKCNHERGQIETAWLARNKPELLHRHTNTGPAPESLLRTQGQLATAILNYVEHAGTLDEGSRADEIRRLAAKLRREYDAQEADRKRRKAEKEAAAAQVDQERREEARARAEAMVKAKDNRGGFGTQLGPLLEAALSKQA